MDCKEIQRHFNDLKISQSSESVAHEIQQHLKDCTDCRVQQQRAARLQQLLAVKRYEKPSPEYFNEFLTEFHKRLDEEQQQPISLWQRISDHLQDFVLLTLRYRYVGGFAILIAIACMWGGLHLMDANHTSRDTFISSNPSQETIASIRPGSTPSTAFHTKNPDPFETEYLARFLSVETEAEASTPDYILESIIPTPVNYEVDSVHF